ncbi:DUF6289 family protein [Longispora sp. K20-0274]|uniref:DUF6289 family protein n=1 Tax=Longispora sp. K20-0274 TaxID=3088255 RepID=UPI00399BF003
MIRRVLLAAALAGGALALSPAAPAQALPQCPAGYMCSHIWYSDAAHTHANGARMFDCKGAMTQWGTLTGYYQFLTQRCVTDPPPAQ